MSSRKGSKSPKSKNQIKEKMGNQATKITNYFKPKSVGKGSVKSSNLGEISASESETELDGKPPKSLQNGNKNQPNSDIPAAESTGSGVAEVIIPSTSGPWLKTEKQGQDGVESKGSTEDQFSNGSKTESIRNEGATFTNIDKNLPAQHILQFQKTEEQVTSLTLSEENEEPAKSPKQEEAAKSTEHEKPAKSTEKSAKKGDETPPVEERMEAMDYEGDTQEYSQEMAYYQQEYKKNKRDYDGSSDEYSEKWDRPWKTKQEPSKTNYSQKKPQVKRKRNPRLFRGYSDRDTQEYRAGYPGKKDIKNYKDNYLFYSNAISSKPNGDYIDNIHKHWWGDYDRLEIHHQYIQWLFPIRETGLNWHAQELQLHEAQAIQRNPQAHARVLKSYEMMLDFYGMKLVDSRRGTIQRSANCLPRFRHLNRSMHNYLRITRILKCLGEMGYEYLKVPFIEFIIREALELGTLSNVIDSCVNYWIGTIKDDRERKRLREMAEYIDDSS